MRVDILTLFPSMFRQVLNQSILKIAQDKGLLDVRVTDIRNFTYNRHHTADDCPYGGGPGMILKPEPIFRAVEAILPLPGVRPRLILLSPQGRCFHQKLAMELCQEKHLALICGHYEGFDERIRCGLRLEEISIGDYILTGGELPAMVILDAVVRLIPGVLGCAESLQEESLAQDLLEYPHYTRPEEWRGMAVPDVLRSGDHKKIEAWRKEQALARTKEKRPDLLPKSLQL